MRYNRAVHDPDHPLDMSLVTVDPSNGYVKAMVGGQDFAARSGQPGARQVRRRSRRPGRLVDEALHDGRGPRAGRHARHRVCRRPARGRCRAAPSPRRQDCIVHGEPAATMAPGHRRVEQHLLRPAGLRRRAEQHGQDGQPPGRDPPRSRPAPTTARASRSGVEPVSPLDMASGYSTFENHGVKNDPTPVIKITDPTGTVLEDNTNRAGTQVLNPAIADTVTDLLRGRSRTARPARRWPTSVDRPPARPAPPTTTATPGSSATRRSSPRRCGSATPTASMPLKGVRHRPGLRRHHAGPDLEGVHEAGARRAARARLPGARVRCPRPAPASATPPSSPTSGGPTSDRCPTCPPTAAARAS